MYCTAYLLLATSSVRVGKTIYLLYVSGLKMGFNLRSFDEKMSSLPLKLRSSLITDILRWVNNLKRDWCNSFFKIIKHKNIYVHFLCLQHHKIVFLDFKKTVLSPKVFEYKGV